MRLQKHVNLRDRAEIDGMLELFKVFNHANYGSYTTQESSASYGLPITTCVWSAGAAGLV